MHTTHSPLDATLLNDLQSAITATLIRHGHGSNITISDNSGSTASTEKPRLFIEVSLSGKTSPETMHMDQVFATPIIEFLKMPCFNKGTATSLWNHFSLDGSGPYKHRKPILVIGDLVDYTKSDVYRWQGIGKKKRILMESALDSIGLRFGMGPRIKGPKEIEVRARLSTKYP